MAEIAAGQGTEDTSTLEHAANGFANFLSSEYGEDPEDSETQPTQESPESESEDEEVVPEAIDSEDEPEPTDDESEEQAEEPAFDGSVKVKLPDGEEVTLEELHKGRLRQADYTRKTQELATARKAQEAEFNAVKGERAKYAGLMSELEQALVAATGQEPDWAKVQTDAPELFPSMWAQWQQRQAEIKAISDEKSRAMQAVAQDHAAQRQSYVEAEHAKLLDSIPEWKDATKSKADKAAIVAYAEKVGFTREELSEVVDHRAILMLRKAMLYDKAQATKPALVKRIEKVKTATPGPSQPAKKQVSEVTRARQRLAKTGGLQDAAAAFATMLPDD